MSPESCAGGESAWVVKNLNRSKVCWPSPPALKNLFSLNRVESVRKSMDLASWSGFNDWEIRSWHLFLDELSINIILHDRDFM